MATGLQIEYGEKPIQVVEFEQQIKASGEKVVVPIIHVDRIGQIIRDSKAENIPVVIISVAGAARSGKSFLLNLMINRNKWQNEKKKTDWIKSGRIITGLNWAQSDKAVTHGMWMWDRAIITQLNDGSEVAFLYMDTQGTGDRIESGVPSMDPLIMFLSLEISAIQIHNINQTWTKIDTEIYEVCKLYSEKVDIHGQNAKLFNSLVLLYRNWQNDYRHGFIENYLETEISENTSKAEYAATLNGIKESFNSVCAVMLPYPGKRVAMAKEELSLTEIKERFLTDLESFMEQIYGPHGGLQKNMAFCKKGHQVIKLLEELHLRVGRSDLPAIQKPIDHLAETVNFQAYSEAIASYREDIDKTETSIESVNDLDNVAQEFDKHKGKAMIKFNSKAFRHGGHAILQLYVQKLEGDMERSKDLRVRYLETRLAAEEVRKKEGKNAEFMKLMEDCRKLREQMEMMLTNRGWGIIEMAKTFGTTVAEAGKAAFDYIAASLPKFE